jgi:beta-lactamase regulating signal transducer with metallopeptidase domain
MNETLLMQGCLSAVIWTVEATLILLGAWLVTLRFRKNAALRHLSWLIALCALLLLPLLSTVVPTLWVVRTSAPTKVGDLLRSAPSQSWKNTGSERIPQGDDGKQRHSLASTPRQQSRATSTPMRRYGTPVRTFLVCLWSLGFVTVIARLLSALWAIQRLRQRSVTKRVPAVDREQLAARIGLRRTWELRIGLTPLPPVAMTWGVLRPVVLLPKDAVNWSTDQLDAVLLHELAHIKRGDSASQLLALVVCAVFWFHPAVWAAAATMRADAELAADDAVLLSGMKPSTYAAQLLGFAAQLGQRRPHRLEMGVSLMKQSQIETRIRSIVDASSRRRTLTIRDALQSGSLALLLVILLSTIRPALSGAAHRQAPLVSLKPTPLLSRLHQAVPGLKSIAFMRQTHSPASARKKRNTRSLSPDVVSNSDLRHRRNAVSPPDARPRFPDKRLSHNGSPDVLPRSADSPPKAHSMKPNSVASSADIAPGRR